MINSEFSKLLGIIWINFEKFLMKKLDCLIYQALTLHSNGNQEWLTVAKEADQVRQDFEKLKELVGKKKTQAPGEKKHKH